METRLKFIDLFAGIGGFHVAFHSLGLDCVFASEKDEKARETYKNNFKSVSPDIFEKNKFNDDILSLDFKDIPEFDILCAGFPCQPFSQAGHKLGFGENLEARGNMFFVLRDIIRAKRPKAIFLENVRHILNHDGRRTFSTIKDIIENELEYDFYYQVVEASDYGLPQHRPRVFMIGFDKELGLPKDFVFPKEQESLNFNMSDVFNGDCTREIGFTLRVGGKGSVITDRRNWEFYYVDGEIRRIGVKEGKRMMGFPAEFDFPTPQVSKNQAMKQLGNSVAVDAVRAVGRSLIDHLQKENKAGSLEINRETGYFETVYKNVG